MATSAPKLSTDPREFVGKRVLVSKEIRLEIEVELVRQDA